VAREIYSGTNASIDSMSTQTKSGRVQTLKSRCKYALLGMTRFVFAFGRLKTRRWRRSGCLHVSFRLLKEREHWRFKTMFCRLFVPRFTLKNGEDVPKCKRDFSFLRVFEVRTSPAQELLSQLNELNPGLQVPGKAQIPKERDA
jgi:hypothetical protein